MLFRGLLATQLSGSLDGLVAAHNSGGAYFRNRTTPTDPNTSRQIYMRTALNAAYLNWLDLSPEQRAVWESYARSIARTNRIGAVRHNSGWNEFVRAFTYRTYIESALPNGLTTTLGTISLPEVTFSGPSTGVISTGANTMELSFDTGPGWYDDPENSLALELSGVRTAPGVISITPYPPTRNFFKGPWQLVVAAKGQDAGSPIVATLSRNPTQFERVFWRARITSLAHGLSSVQYGVAIAP